MKPLSQEKKATSVEFRNVTKQYGPVTAVNNVSFTVAPGTLVTLLGPSGCGKTTTLRMIAGLEIATTGQILIGQQDVTHLSAAQRDVSMVFQSYALFPHMTVLENAAYGLVSGGMRKDKARAVARDKLALVGLKDLDHRLPSELSGGQQQRVAVARALVLEPQVLLFDEPLSNLDAKIRRKVRDDIRQLQQSLNLTVVYVTHDQQEALAVSDRIIVMANAVIAQSGTPRELYEQPASRFVADFIGEANLVGGHIQSADGKSCIVDLGGKSFTITDRGLPPGPVTVAIRPEAFIVTDSQPQGPALQGKIVKAAYLGSNVEYTIITVLGALFIIDRDVAAIKQPGTPVWLTPTGHGMITVPAGMSS